MISAEPMQDKYWQIGFLLSLAILLLDCSEKSEDFFLQSNFGFQIPFPRAKSNEAANVEISIIISASESF